MSEVEILVAKIAADLMVAVIQYHGPTRDPAYAHQCVAHAKTIVAAALREDRE